MGRIEIIKYWRSCALAVCLSVLSFNASAFILETAKVIDSYSACRWKNNGDGTSTLGVTIKFRPAAGNHGNVAYVSRGILVYNYDRMGNLRPSTTAAKRIILNGSYNFSSYVGDGYAIYYGLSTEWRTERAFTANIEVLIDNSQIADWPGMSLRAANYTQGNDFGEVTGAAYLTMASTDGTCIVLDPAKPPPPAPSFVLDTVAPDWDLGELPRGESQKTLAGASQQLCFTYTGFASSGNFVINATNANGMSGNRYLLRNTSKPEQTVPYSVTLNGGSANFPLPNIGASAIRLNTGNRTCFVPTFKTSVGMSAGAGDYSDVLLFTVVTKS